MRRKNKNLNLKKELLNLSMMLVGSFIVASAFCMLIDPAGLLAGGVMGVADLLNHFIPAVPLPLFMLALNIPLLLWGWSRIDLSFAVYTLISVGLQTLLLLVLPSLLPTYNNDPMLSCIFGGLLLGAGSGVIVRFHGSAGGVDIVGVIFKNKYDIPVGTVSLAVNACVVILAGAVYGFEPAMYTIIELYCTSVSFNMLLSGFNRKRNMTIITEHGPELTQHLLRECGRGVTVIHGEGGFTHRSKQVLLVVLSRFEMAAIKEIIAECDPEAFVCVNETYEVLGRFAKKAQVEAARRSELE